MLNTPANANRFTLDVYLLHTRLRPFLLAKYKAILEQATKGLHTDAMELLDRLLSLLADTVLHEEIVGFLAFQGESLAKAASQVCEAWEKGGKIPFHRVMVYARRYIKVDLSPAFYDLATDTEIQIAETYAPAEVTNYILGAVYGHIVTKREARETKEGFQR